MTRDSAGRWRPHREYVRLESGHLVVRCENENGLTYEEWYAAVNAHGAVDELREAYKLAAETVERAGGCKVWHLNWDPAPERKLRKAWRGGVDPTDLAATFARGEAL